MPVKSSVSLMSSLFLLLAMSLASGLAGNVAIAQEGPKPTPTLLRRIAEAVEAHEPDQDVFILAEVQYPNIIYGSFRSRKEAIDSAVAWGVEIDDSTTAVLGAYRNHELGQLLPEDTLLISNQIPFRDRVFLPFCPHDHYSSVYDALRRARRWNIEVVDFSVRDADSIRSYISQSNGPILPSGLNTRFDRTEAICPARRSLPRRAISHYVVSVIYQDTLGTRRVSMFRLPSSTDAFFNSIVAIDKFVLRYYTPILGLDETASLRRRIIRGFAQAR